MRAPPYARVFRWLVPGVFLALCAARNLPWRVADYDQAKQASVALEITGGGNPFFQHTPGGQRLATKPPLVAWVAAGLHALPGLGKWEVAWRLPSLLATVALTAVLWRAGRAAWPGVGGWLTLGAFGLNLLAPRLATLVRTDMALTLWTTLAGLLIWHRRGPGCGPWTARDRGALCAVLTAAVLTKGPIIYAFLLPGLAALAVWERHLRTDDLRVVPDSFSEDVASPRSRDDTEVVRPRIWPWLLPLAVFALWVAVGWQTVPGFRDEVVGREFLGRFDYSERAVHVRQPVWFYALGLLLRWSPWSLLLLGTVFLARPAWRAVMTGDPAGRWLVCWAAGGLLLMSLVPSKRLDRVFPVIPPLCLLLTTVVRRTRGVGGEGETLAVWATAAAVVISVAATGYETRKAYRLHEDALDQFGRYVRRWSVARGGPPVELAVNARVDQSDETLLVCLRRPRWLEPTEAAAAWRTGRTDALVLQAPTDEMLRPVLGVEGTDYRVEARVEVPREQDENYVLLVRLPPAVAASRPFAAPGPIPPR